jgi:hypothetical protein
VTTKGRALDHIGFDVNNLQAFCKKPEASGIKLDRPYSKNANGIGMAFIYDPWGTYIELNERPNAVYIQHQTRSTPRRAVQCLSPRFLQLDREDHTPVK